jgi:branched-chain amino acid transport system permease protein
MSIQIIINGLTLGAVYSLIAVGYSLIFTILKFSNFAYGSLITGGAFIGFFITSALHLSLTFTIITAMIGAGFVSVAGEFIAFRTITRKGSSVFYYFVSSLTLGVLLDAVIVLIVGSNFYTYPQFFEKIIVRAGGIVFSVVDLSMFFCSVAALLLLMLFLGKTRYGRAIWAVSYDLDTAYLMGINVFQAIQITFFIAGSLAGLSGVFLGISYTLYPQLGSIVTKGFIASVIGGLGSISGAVIGAFLLGLCETLLIHFVGSGFTPVFTFLIMMLFLFIRPQGISGSNVQQKA